MCICAPTFDVSRRKYIMEIVILSNGLRVLSFVCAYTTTTIPSTRTSRSVVYKYILTFIYVYLCIALYAPYRMPHHICISPQFSILQTSEDIITGKKKMRFRTHIVLHSYIHCCLHSICAEHRANIFRILFRALILY